MEIPHDHLKRFVPEQLCDSAQIHSGHTKSTGKGMAVAMPAIGIQLLEGRCAPLVHSVQCAHFRVLAELLSTLKVVYPEVVYPEVRY